MRVIRIIVVSYRTHIGTAVVGVGAHQAHDPTAVLGALVCMLSDHHRATSVPPGTEVRLRFPLRLLPEVNERPVFLKKAPTASWRISV